MSHRIKLRTSAGTKFKSLLPSHEAVTLFQFQTIILYILHFFVNLLKIFCSLANICAMCCHVVMVVMVVVGLAGPMTQGSNSPRLMRPMQSPHGPTKIVALCAEERRKSLGSKIVYASNQNIFSHLMIIISTKVLLESNIC